MICVKDTLRFHVVNKEQMSQLPKTNVKQKKPQRPQHISISKSNELK